MSNLGLPVVVSGIRATGGLHLGNYFGAIRYFFPLQESHRCYFFVADYHTLTTAPDPEVLRSNRLPIVKTFLATGIDPQKAVIFYQSSLPEVAELTLLLGMSVPVGELERCVTFKEKVRQNPDNVNHGLLTYPILMAADILIQKANLVPVGQDQLQHLEMARDFASRFNRKYCEIFPSPQSMQGEALRLLGLDGEKMSKSEHNTIELLDGPETVSAKILKGVTDTNRKKRNDPGDPQNNCVSIFPLHELFSSTEQAFEIISGCKAGTLACVECKKMVAEKVNGFLAPFQEKYRQFSNDYVKDVLLAGAKQAKDNAQVTLSEVRQAMGLD